MCNLLFMHFAINASSRNMKHIFNWNLSAKICEKSVTNHFHLFCQTFFCGNINQSYYGTCIFQWFWRDSICILYSVGLWQVTAAIYLPNNVVSFISFIFEILVILFVFIERHWYWYFTDLPLKVLKVLALQWVKTITIFLQE